MVRFSANPGSIHPHTKFHGQVYVLTKEEGGRHTPFFNNYRPQFYFRTTDVTGIVSLPAGTEMCMPGDNVEMDVELITPSLSRKASRIRTAAVLHIDRSMGRKVTGVLTMVKAIVGANWGDEGKGKITDMLATSADVVVRFQGGANAGHTIKNQYGKFALHLLSVRRFQR